MLFVCSGNIIRSPMAQAFLGATAQRRGLDITASSAGILPGVREIPDDTLAAIGQDGLDMHGHVSRPLTRELLVEADLVLGMTAEHVREAVVLHDPCWPRAFTLREIVRRGELVGPRRSDQGRDQWLALVHGGRQRMDLLRPVPGDDLADPVGGPRSVIRSTAKEIHRLTDRLLDLMG